MDFATEHKESHVDKVWLIPRKCLNEAELLTSMTEKP